LQDWKKTKDLEAAHSEATPAKQERKKVGQYIPHAYDIIPLTKVTSRNPKAARDLDDIA
jgi:hypothetical protein